MMKTRIVLTLIIFGLAGLIVWLYYTNEKVNSLIETINNDKENKSRPGFRHDITPNVASFLIQQNILHYQADLPLTVQINFAEKYGFGGFFDMASIKDLAGNWLGSTFFLCLKDGEFHIAAAKLKYNPSVGENSGSVNLRDNDRLYFSNCIKWTYAQPLDYRAVISFINSSPPSVPPPAPAQPQLKWSEVKTYVDNFGSKAYPSNNIVSNFLHRDDLSKLYDEAYNDKCKGIYVFVGYDETELKNPFRLIMFEVNNDNTLNYWNKIILERTLP
ncbi:MAG: hypothetical protein ABI723_15565 [Bacteroidia bacterium]